MNRKIRGYINYLEDNNPSPFCDYIICKELLKADEETVYGAYDWAKRFKLYEEIEKEQYPDGSWGGFDTAHTEKVKGKHYKATARAIFRLLDLSLDVTDPMTRRAVDVCKKYLTGELPDPESYGKNNTLKPLLIRRQIIQNLSYFEPENEFVAELRNYSAELFAKSCKKGFFDRDVWNQSDKIVLGAGDWSHEMSGLLSYGNVIGDDLQQMLLSYKWENTGWVHPSEIRSPDEPSFIFWIAALESLKHFSLFGQFMAEKAAPHLYSVCEQIINDSENQMKIHINNYFYHYGQYSEQRNIVQKKKNDLLLQIIRILDKCD